jgi:hypothetical protein
MWAISAIFRKLYEQEKQSHILVTLISAQNPLKNFQAVSWKEANSKK